MADPTFPARPTVSPAEVAALHAIRDGNLGAFIAPCVSMEVHAHTATAVRLEPLAGGWWALFLGDRPQLITIKLCPAAADVVRAAFAEEALP